MSSRPLILGTHGKAVARNVAFQRRALQLDLAGLSERLATLGRPIGVSALSKVEQGVRRVDVDDLVALASALNTSVTDLVEGTPQLMAQEYEHAR